jgi:hypothetical protein
MPDGDGETGTAIRSAACPGGMARQYRVQVHDTELPQGWRLVGSFRDAESAARCAEQWGECGQQARIIDCRALPTAA